MELSRRAFLQGGVLFLAGASSPRTWAGGLSGIAPVARIGLVTDIHHADKVSAGTRFYRQALPKLRESLKTLGGEGIDRLINLGDIVDSVADTEAEEQAIRVVTAECRELGKPFHSVMGNHCLSAVDKSRFGELTGTQGSHEFFDQGGVRFVLLDACYRSDGTPYARGDFDWTDTAIPEHQVRWLKRVLSEAQGPCVVLVHQLLEPVPSYCVKNNEEVREVISASKKVIAVVQGHYHQNRLAEIGGVPYIVQRSIIDGPALLNRGSAVLSVFSDGSASIRGFSEQKTYTFRGAPNVRAAGPRSDGAL